MQDEKYRPTELSIPSNERLLIDRVDLIERVELHSRAMLMLCPICAEEFVEQFVICPGCGCSLVPSSLTGHFGEEIGPKPDKKIEFVELCRPSIYPVAMLIKEMLEQNGIPVFIKGGHSLSVMPQLAFGGELRVLVASNRLEYARALYVAYFESDDDIDYLPGE